MSLTASEPMARHYTSTTKPQPRNIICAARMPVLCCFVLCFCFVMFSVMFLLYPVSASLLLGPQRRITWAWQCRDSWRATMRLLQSHIIAASLLAGPQRHITWTWQRRVLWRATIRLRQSYNMVVLSALHQSLFELCCCVFCVCFPFVVCSSCIAAGQSTDNLLHYNIIEYNVI